MNITRLACSVPLAAFVAAIVSTTPGISAQPNLALTAKISVSSQQDGFPKTNAIDGDRRTEWAGNDGHPWITLRWKEPVTVGRIVVRDRADPGSKAQGGKLLFGDAGNSVAPRTLDVDDIQPGGAPCEVRFEPRRVRWLRLDLFMARGPHPGLAEFEVYADGGAMPAPAKAVYPRRAHW